jgi:hypothetical protein
LATVDFFKTCEGITDNNAVKGLTLLLEGTAHIWWTGTKGSIFTWTEAQTAIRNEFAPSPPAFQVYQQVFATRQDDQTPTGLFTFEKRALLAQVNPPDTESRQIDFIYGLLRLEIRDRVPRKTIRDFTSLLDAARKVEAVMRERRSETTAKTSKKVRVKCSYCGNKGHDITTCRKRERAEKSEKHSKPGELVKAELRCYGCGKPGVIKQNCPLCSPHQDTTAAQTLSFHALSIEPTERPAVDITIFGLSGTAFLDSGARTSLESPKLQGELKKLGLPFTKQVAKLILADGRAENKLIQTVMVSVTLKGRTFTTPLVCTEGGPEAATLLGVRHRMLHYYETSRLPACLHSSPRCR